MTSKIQESKNAQGYTKKPRQCNNCKNYKSEITLIPADNGYKAYNIEKTKRCGIGGFAVASSASCDLYTHET